MEKDEKQLSFTIGSTTINVITERMETLLSRQDFDAVVSSDDTHLTMSGGLSAAIARLAGKEILSEIAALVPLPMGTVAVTGAGHLRARFIFHAVTVDRHNNVLATERTLRQLGRQIFVRCEALKVRHAAVPLATGTSGFSPIDSARIVLECLLEHLANPSCLTDVTFSAPGQDVFAAFRDTVGRLRRSLEPQLQDQNEATQPLTTQHLPHKQPPEPFSPLDGLTRSLVGERYVLLEELGRGGMSVVYLAWDLVLRRVVAIKALRKDKCDPEVLRQEATIALELTHESILRVYHFEPQREPDTGPFLVMEYLPWTTGEKWIADAGAGRLPVQTVVELGIRLCSGLEYAHKRNILHGDIKPGNVFVDSAGESVKLADFGLSRVVAEKSLQTLSLRPSGTPAYMAPEQRVRGEKVGLAADIYQLGATLWDFLTGKPPDSDRRIPRILEPERARTLKAVRKALAAQPGERFQNVTEFGRALEDAV